MEELNLSRQNRLHTVADTSHHMHMRTHIAPETASIGNESCLKKVCTAAYLSSQNQGSTLKLLQREYPIC